MNQPVKKPYSKPIVTQIPLKAEEAVLTACKTAPGGAAGNPCGAVGHPNASFGS